MIRVHRPLPDHPGGAGVGLLAVLVLAAMPLLAASAFGAPAAQTSIYLPLAQRS